MPKRPPPDPLSRIGLEPERWLWLLLLPLAAPQLLKLWLCRARRRAKAWPVPPEGIAGLTNEQVDRLPHR